MVNTATSSFKRTRQANTFKHKRDTMRNIAVSILIFLFLKSSVAFVPGLRSSTNVWPRPWNGLAKMANGETSVTLSTELTDQKVTELFAWVSRAFAGEDEYNNLMLAIAVVFGDLGSNSVAGQMANRLKSKAMSMVPDEEELCGQPFSTDDREIASKLGCDCSKMRLFEKQK